MAGWHLFDVQPTLHKGKRVSVKPFTVCHSREKNLLPSFLKFVEFLWLCFRIFIVNDSFIIQIAYGTVRVLGAK